jgi:hypothetical protein
MNSVRDALVPDPVRREMGKHLSELGQFVEKPSGTDTVT